jgi:hypothetical protein
MTARRQESGEVNADYSHQLAILECVIYMAQFSAAGRIDYENERGNQQSFVNCIFNHLLLTSKLRPLLEDLFTS